MLYGIKQTDARLIEPIRKWGCLFLCFAESSPMIFANNEGCHALNGLWKRAVELGYISGDLNGDGDADDDGESEILNHDAVASLFSLSVHYDGKHHAASEVIPPSVKIIFGQYFYKSGHFVVLNHNKEVTFDSRGYSNTVMNGKLISMRWYYAD